MSFWTDIGAAGKISPVERCGHDLKPAKSAVFKIGLVLAESLQLRTISQLAGRFCAAHGARHCVNLVEEFPVH